MSILLKDPDATLDYGVDWSVYLTSGETITASSWIVTPTGDLTTSAPSYMDDSTQVSLSGGIAGKIYRVTNRITTSLGRSDDRSFTIRVEQQ